MNRPDQHHKGASDVVAADAGAARNLALRTVSAAVLAPAGLAAAFLGGWFFLILCAIAAGAILWEWTSLVAVGADRRILLPGFAALLVATTLIGGGHGGAAGAAIIVGAAAAGGAIAVWPRRSGAYDPVAWGAGGVVYAGIALLGPALLRRDPELGLTAMLFLFATVWSTDVLAYFVGRAVGGPLLWPQLSPKKTWAGAIGGLAGGVAAGTLVAYASGAVNPAVAGVLSLLLSVVAQAGDLFESAVKRRFGAKDASSLIPGHGGVMDRLDGFLVAAFLAVLIGILRQGLAAPAQGLLIW